MSRIDRQHAGIDAIVLGQHADAGAKLRTWRGLTIATRRPASTSSAARLAGNRRWPPTQWYSRAAEAMPATDRCLRRRRRTSGVPPPAKSRRRTSTSQHQSRQTTRSSWLWNRPWNCPCLADASSPRHAVDDGSGGCSGEPTMPARVTLRDGVNWPRHNRSLAGRFFLALLEAHQKNLPLTNPLLIPLATYKRTRGTESGNDE